MSESDKRHIDSPFRLAQIYLVSAAMTHRGQPLSLPQNTPIAPQRLTVSIGLQHLDDGKASQVIVAIRSDADDRTPNVMYDFAVEIAGIVEQVDRSKFPDRELVKVVATMIYPFAREAVANLTGRGRFGPVWLNPFNVREAVGQAPLEEMTSE